MNIRYFEWRHSRRIECGYGKFGDRSDTPEITEISAVVRFVRDRGSACLVPRKYWTEKTGSIGDLEASYGRL